MYQGERQAIETCDGLTNMEPDPSDYTRNQSEVNSRGSQHTRGRTYTDGTTESETTTNSQSKTTTESSGRSSSVGGGVSEAISISNSRSESQSESIGLSESEGESETWVNVAEEYQELSSRTFWSLQELEYMQMADLKNQGIAQAFFKLRDGSPMQVQIERIDSTFYHNRTSEQRLKRFKGKNIC